MNQNVRPLDRKLRAVVGAVSGTASVAVLVEIIQLPMLFSPVLGLVAIMTLATAAEGSCPMYSVLGVNACQYNASAGE